MEPFAKKPRANENGFGYATAPSQNPYDNNGTDSKTHQDTHASNQTAAGLKAKPCMKFFSTFGCQYGDGCHFLHYIPGGVNAMSLASSNSFGNSGMGGPRKHSGPAADPSVAVNGYKTKLCNKFQTSEGCRFGNKCHFAHGEADLRPANAQCPPNPPPVASGPPMPPMPVMSNSTPGMYSGAHNMYENGNTPYSMPNQSAYANTQNYSNLPTNTMQYGEPIPPGVASGMSSAFNSTLMTSNNMASAPGGAPVNAPPPQYY